MAKPLERALRRLIDPAYRALETRARVLRYLFIEITQRCNLSCLHCGSDCSKDAQRDELTTEEWLRFFEYLPGHFDRRELALVVTGGEPFCCPDFDAILGGLKAQGISWGMVTNGFTLSDANVAKVVEHGIMSMTVSLDGLQDSHDWLRGREGSYQRAVEGLRRVAGAGLPNFDVVTCVNPRNLGELDQVCDVLRECGVPAWRLFCIFPKGRAKENPALKLSDDQMRQLFSWMKAKRRELAGTGFVLNFSCEGYLPARWDREVRDDPYFCRAGINIASVLCDGAICACPNITRSLVQGNIRSDDFKEVWENRFGSFVDRDWMKTGPCSSCDQWSRCQGNSLHLWDDEARRTVLCHHRVLGGSTP
ncbi:MAG: radical SAM protein [Deltaproteobacteria bacterium]|nr:radical SAM protein [Deltaproteobacteria bacterium]